MQTRTVDIVVPVFNEAPQVPLLLARVGSVMKPLHIDYRVIFVDDGSADGTWEVLGRAFPEIPRLKAIRLSRNFGKEAALMAGIGEVSADACIVMDADLQHPPELIPEMLRVWREQGVPVVEAQKRERGDESVLGRWGANSFYRVLSSVSGLDLANASDFKLLDGRVVQILQSLTERETFFRGLSAWVGFPRARLYFDVPPRSGGKSRWSKWKLAKLALAALTSFSSVPLQIVTSVGVLFLFGSAILAVQTLYMKFAGHAVSGFSTVILLQLIIGSCLMMALGVIGSYLARIFEEVKCRPRFIVSEFRDK